MECDACERQRRPCRQSREELKSDEVLLANFAATSLKLEMDRVPLWRGDSVPIKLLVEDFARYTYLPRLRDPGVLVNAIHEGTGCLTWQRETLPLRIPMMKPTAAIWACEAVRPFRLGGQSHRPVGEARCRLEANGCPKDLSQ